MCYIFNDERVQKIQPLYLWVDKKYKDDISYGYEFFLLGLLDFQHGFGPEKLDGFCTKKILAPILPIRTPDFDFYKNQIDNNICQLV